MPLDPTFVPARSVPAFPNFKTRVAIAVALLACAPSRTPYTETEPTLQEFRSSGPARAAERFFLER